MSFDPLFDSESDEEFRARKLTKARKVAEKGAIGCPACGGEPTVEMDDHLRIRIGCWNECDAYSVGAWRDTAEAAVEAWNEAL